jgi:hypothetical protein
MVILECLTTVLKLSEGISIKGIIATKPYLICEDGGVLLYAELHIVKL